MNKSQPLYFTLSNPFWLLCLFLTFPLNGVSQESSSFTQNADISIESLQSKIDEVDASTSLAEGERAALVELYRKTISEQQTAKEFEEKINDYKTIRTDGGVKLEQLKVRLANYRAKNQTEVSYLRFPLNELELLLGKEKANLAAVKAKFKDLSDKLSYEGKRPSAARQRLIEARREQEKNRGSENLADSVEESSELKQARKWLSMSQYNTLSLEILAIDQELLSQPIRYQMLSTLRDYTAFSLKQLNDKVTSIEGILTNQRLTAAKQAIENARAAESTIQSDSPLATAIINANSELIDLVADSAAELEHIRVLDTTTENENTRLSKEYKSTIKQLEIAGVTQTIGRVLLERKRNLKDLSTLNSEIEQYNERIAKVTLLKLLHQDELSELDDTSTYISNRTGSNSPDELRQTQEELSALLNARTILLQEAVNLDQAVITSLSEIDTAYYNLQDTLRSYHALLNERLLWIRNADTQSLIPFLSLPSELNSWFTGDFWHELANTFQSEPLFVLLLIFTLLMALLLRFRSANVLNKLTESGKFVGKPSKDKFTVTLFPLFITVAISAVWPLVLASLGLIFQYGMSKFSYAYSLSSACYNLAQMLFFLQLLKNLCLPKGLGISHFKWDEATTEKLRKTTDNFILTLPPLLVAVLLIEKTESSHFDVGIGLPALVLLHITLLLFMRKALLLAPWERQHKLREPNNVVYKILSFSVELLVIVIPIALIALALIGYLYGAATITALLIKSMCLMISMMLLNQLLRRWIYMSNRLLVFKAAIERREQAKKLNEEKDENRGSDENIDLIVDDEIDIDSVTKDSKELLNVTSVLITIFGLGVIWSSVTPALNIVNDVVLWSRSEIIDGTLSVVPITLNDGIFTLFILFVTILSAKKLPALLEIMILQRLQVDAGSRYAIKTLTNYFIIAGAVIWITNTLGLPWDKIQWLVAALGVGIGFGLQEIIANFISGLIILFERPIRVGDVITIGDTDGVVTRIRIRATTIRGWDRKELLVPNKEFITGRLLNWTLSDSTTRMMFSVGIAYGSDVEKAMTIIEDICIRHERVLDDPPPFLTFDLFGDNALNITVRSYIGSIEYRALTVSDLHIAINKELAEAGISIAFPQRDIHLDSLKPLEIKMIKAD